MGGNGGDFSAGNISLDKETFVLALWCFIIFNLGSTRLCGNADTGDLGGDGDAGAAAAV